MHYKTGWIGLATVKSCTRYRRKYSFTIYMLQSCELSTHECRHECSKLSEVIAGFTDTPHNALCVSRGRGKRETLESMYSEIVHF
jgi:hypothetical protein